MLFLNPDNLNKAYYDICQSVESNLYTVLWGGRNSAKTYSANQWLLKTLWNEPDANAIYYRKFGSDLKNKCYEPILDVAKSMGMKDSLNPVFHHLSKQIIFPHGNKLIFDFADAKEKSKGLSNIRYVVIDEITQLTLSEFLTVTSSFRADDKIRFIFMFNPISEKHWIKKTLFDNPDKSPTHFSNYCGRYHYTIDDNKFATSNDYINLDAQKDIDHNQYMINRFGIWGSLKTDSPFFDGFNYNLNVVEGSIPFFREYPLYVSFDFGKADVATCSQVFNDYDIESDKDLSNYFKHSDRGAMTFISEHKSGNAQSNVEQIVIDIVEKYGTDVDYYVLGDTAGAGNDGSIAMYIEIRNVFEALRCNYVTFMTRFKPSHKASRRINNWTMRTLAENFLVSKTSCEWLVNDFSQVKCDEYGGQDKNHAIQNDLSHFSDTARYTMYLLQVKNFIRANPYDAGSVLSSGLTRRIENTEYELLED